MIFFIILFKFFIYLCPFSSFVFIEVFKHGRNIEEAAKGGKWDTMGGFEIEGEHISIELNMNELMKKKNDLTAASHRIQYLV